MTLLDEMVNLCRRRWKAYLCLVRHHTNYCQPELVQTYGKEWSALLVADNATTISKTIHA